MTKSIDSTTEKEDQHGWWECSYIDNTENIRATCSKCGASYVWPEPETAKSYKYCPNCRAVINKTKKIKKMRRFMVVIETGYSGYEMFDEFEVEDTASQEEIEKEALEIKKMLTSDWYYQEIKDNDKE